MQHLDVHPRIIQGIYGGGLKTPQQILCLSGPELARRTKLSQNDIQILILAAAEALPCPTMVTALDLQTKNCQEQFKIARLSLGCPVLDQALRGGILSQGVTEISGESASGKTQFCLQLCLTVQLPRMMGGLDGGAVFICTEDVFPIKRLQQTIPQFLRNLPSQVAKELPSPGDNIFIEHASELDDLELLLSSRLPALLSQAKIRLIIIDSIAAIFRVEYTASESAQRAKVLRSFGAHLHKLSSQFQVPVICVNQVSDVIDDKACNSRSWSSGRKVMPALGLAWSNLLTVRLMLSRHEGVYARPVISNHAVNQKDESAPNKKLAVHQVQRKLQVIFAPHLPNITCTFAILPDGVRGLEIMDLDE